VPYSISVDEVSAKDKIEMEFMINSGESKSNAEEYVQDKHANSAAGNLHCVKLSEDNLEVCIDLLSVSSQSIVSNHARHTIFVKADTHV
jgi:hypothetical protein